MFRKFGCNGRSEGDDYNPNKEWKVICKFDNRVGSEKEIVLLEKREEV